MDGSTPSSSPPVTIEFTRAELNAVLRIMGDNTPIDDRAAGVHEGFAFTLWDSLWDIYDSAYGAHTDDGVSGLLTSITFN